MDLYGNVVDIYDLAPIGDYGKMIMAKFATDTTIMANAVWGSSGSPKAVIIDTVGKIIHQTSLLDNNWMAYTEVTFDNKLLFFTNINDDNGNFDTYLFKLNQQLDGDTVYNQWFNYDSLCVGQIVSDTIVQDGCGLIVGMEEIKTEVSTDTEDFLKVFPNPAGTYFIVEHNLTEYEGESKIILSDMHGKTVSNYNLNSAQNQHVISTIDYPSGLYLVQLFINGVIKETEKLSISK
jgi:hypothetical protein